MKVLDLYGFEAKFTIDSDNTFKTRVGGIIFIFLTFSYIALIILFGKEAIDKNSPNGYSEIIPHSYNSSDFFLSLQDNKFLAGFQVIDVNARPLDISNFLFPVFRLKTYEWKNGVINQTQNVIPTMKCNNTNIFGLEIEKTVHLDNYFCPNFTGLDNPTIGGDYSFPVSHVMNFELSMCNENMSKCHDIKETSKFLDDNMVLINVIYPQIIYSKSNFEKPFISRIDNQYTFMNTMASLRQYLYITQNELEDDSGFLLNDIKTIKRYGKGKFYSILKNYENYESWKSQ